VAELSLTMSESVLRRLIGTPLFLQGRNHVIRGDVLSVQWLHRDGRAFGQVVSGEKSHSAMATMMTDQDGSARSVQSSCTCSAQKCAHAAAVLHAALAQSGEQQLLPLYSPAERDKRPEWERSLAALLPPSQQPPAAPELALQFELGSQPGKGGAAHTRIGLRPVVPGAKGNWIRGGISWGALQYRHDGSTETARQHVRLLREIQAIYAANGNYYAYNSAVPFLDAAPSRRIWDLLSEAEELGLPLVQAGKGKPPVALHATPAEATVEVGRAGDGLELGPRITVDGVPLELSSTVLIGTPVHGLAWWDTAIPVKERVLRMAPLSGPLDPRFTAMLAAGPIQVPAQDEDRFLRDFYPRLRRQVTVTAAEVQLPQARPPALVLDVKHLPEHRVALRWSWTYTLGETSRPEPLRPVPGLISDRDAPAEKATLSRVTAASEGIEALFESSPAGRRLSEFAELGGIEMIRFLRDVLPVLSTLPDLHVVLAAGEDVMDYHEAVDDPVISIAGDQAQDDRDWFNLAVTVSVDGQLVPFDQLFVALAQQREHLILSSGTYFSLIREEFRRLSELIAEARALQDVETGSVRLSRFQAGLWEELERIGVVSGQAADWQEAVRALANATEAAEHYPPVGLHATMRPYQLAGFNWLATLYSYQLGGILADDMGLGKTLQALALFCHVRELGLSSAPFLVVAPTSVVSNWAMEAERFTPGLTVAAISETRARRGTDLHDVIAGADVVITSYTLFRLEYPDYAAVDWAGLVLDEAQFVKNHQSQSYQCVKKLPAPFKLAITGTPMENNLMELWALLSVTAPGLFSNPARFTEYYRTPIEKGHDVGLLDQLRRRVRPLMLRRRKDQVASDLPDKQEQVLELELNPKHRKVYQTHLQRERQKVLGLLGDLDKNRFEIFRSLTLLRQASLDVSLIDPKYASISSTKLDAMMERVQDIVGEGHRTLIFSQFTRFLSSARDRLAAAGIDYCYLDGSTTNRPAVLREFKTGSAPVFLISLKAGGFGLNLTEADYCILLDPWWNPATEAQAVDRVHRIGQTKKVMVYRLVAKDTIEEKVMALKAGKSALFSSVMDGGGFESAALSAADIRGLLD
jgi:superfamily II DNA or RNA helicase